ncbi:hypothetical protein P4O66_015053 [Electrophorus voltai]|uniref:B box-type domain-containing protein n=1 Tax=Electrophorus voltai TaxID=2609070 RepID=A0AAD9DPD2_9TELE|nr:hypothetical protein P4O66_015053 [Electrophorus voltai]
MPVAVMMGENYQKLLEQCETQELEAPGGIATPQVYSQLLALYLLHNDMNNARYLWKRIPQAIKTANPELAAVWAVGQRIWQRDFPGIYSAIAGYQWSETILPVMESLRGGVFRCPTCRFEVVLDRHGVHGLQRNLLVENIIDIYKQQQEGNGRTSEVPLKSKGSPEPLCEEHEDERINIYCVSHQVPTCSMCKIFGPHKDCEVSPLAAVHQAQKGELSNAIDSLVAGNGRLQALLNQMEEVCRAVQDNAHRAKQGLGERFDTLYATLEERKNILLERISEEQDEKVAALRRLARCYGDRLQAATELTDTAVRALEQSSAADFLQSSKSLIEQTKDAARNSTRRRAYSLVAQAYTSISVEDLSSFVGYSVEEAVRGVVSHGWQADPNTRMIMPQKPDPPPVTLVPNEQQLARLTDYVAFLEN